MPDYPCNNKTVSDEIEVCVAGTFVADKFITILNRTKNPFKGSISRSNNAQT